MKIKVRGRVWDFVRAYMTEADGRCDPPSKVGKKILVDKRLRGERELDVIIHEIMHAAHWDIAEEAIEETASDIARALYRLGYRKSE